MAKIEPKRINPEDKAQHAQPAPVVEPIKTDPAMVEVGNSTVERAMNAVNPPEDKKDDPVMETHPQKDYQLHDNSNMLGGRRQFQPDLLARRLNCNGYYLDVYKNWGVNPFGGPPAPIHYTRDFPQVKILYDNFDVKPDPKVLKMKSELAHKHGYRYLYQAPGMILTPENLEKQLEAEEKFKQ